MNFAGRILGHVRRHSDRPNRFRLSCPSLYKRRLILRETSIIGSCSSNSSATMASSGGGNANWKNASSIYEFEALDIDGNNVKLDKYNGKVCLIVNVASKCGFTNKNYTQLQALHAKHAEKGLAILGFLCNQFGGQEPGTEAEIKEFVKGFDVQFDMFSKIDVNGNNAHPLFNYLKKEQKGTLGNFIKWNFSKFLVNREGKPVNRYAPNTEPFVIEKDIEKYL